jgi:putative membrane-bound dehydrogenase-like protein
MSADLTNSLHAQNYQPTRRRFHITRLLASTCILFFACNTEVLEESNQGYPRVLDQRLKLTLFAEHPDIVTPIGIAVDRSGMVYVLESHTHTPPKDYDGPDTDRIRIFSDSDGDGKPEKNVVFAEGFEEGVNITFSPDGNLYVVTSRAVYALFDHDGDFRADEKKEILVLHEPEKVYAHAALLGITFSSDGWMYVSRGNTGSAFWKLKGTYGSSLSGYGDGGNIVRAMPDGSKLEEVATGFWNPVDIKFNLDGQLFTVDNDPDSRGPNRLVHVVPGGDYGYKSLYGGSGIHPYLAWNGELPGKLPFAAALGEAPSGLLDATLTSLPFDSSGVMLATIWEESRVVRVDLKPSGKSLKGDASVLIEGGTDFRPVALAAGPKGEVYLTDWMLRKYPNHGKGRIWKISSTTGKEGSDAVSIKKEIRQPLIGHADEDIMERLTSGDPFERHAAVMDLSDSANEKTLLASLTGKDSRVKLGGMLAMQRRGYSIPASMMRKLLNDADEVVRMQALIWIGEESLIVYQKDLTDVLKFANVSPALFDVYLETVRHLQPDFIESLRTQKEPYAKSIPRTLPTGFLANLIRDEKKSPYIRALAMKYIENPDEQALLLGEALSRNAHPVLRAEATRLLASVTRRETADRLLGIAVLVQEDPSLRADALIALSRQPGDFVSQVATLLSDSAEDVRLEAARYIRLKSASSDAIQIAMDAINATHPNGSVQEQLQMIIDKSQSKGTRHPSSVDEWSKLVASGGDAARGRRVFYSTQGMCSSCHAIKGTGGDLGPDLTKVALSKTRLQLLRATIEPSSEISPEFQGWFVRLDNGEEVRGRQIDIGEEVIELYTHTSGFRSFSKKDVSDYGMIETSLMPSGLEANLTISDVRDLMAFLETSAKAP